MDSTVDCIVSFLLEIGVSVRACELAEDTVLPGISIERGVLLYDPRRLKYPGDLLHESGHIAFTPASQRPALSGNATSDLGEDIAAIAWSYAAAVHLGIDPAIVFHEAGYRGASRAYIENFSCGRYVGVPLLEWAGMTIEKKRHNNPAVAYPEMIKWLRDE